jgi:two-component system, NtrC family, nitrogen regulation sensor histidine kinase NtrY
MRLRTRLTFAIASASVVPIVAAALVGRELVERRSVAEFERLLSGGEVEVRRGYRELSAEVERAAAALTDPDDQFTGPILIQLARGGPDDETFRWLALVAPRVMRERGLDVLTVLGKGGEILASGHFPGRMGDTEPDLARTVEKAAPHTGTASGPFLVSERLLEDGKPATRLALDYRGLARSPLGARAVVQGGRLLGPALLARLRLAGGTEVAVRDDAGQLVAESRPGAAAATRRAREVILRGAGRETARVLVAVPDDRLRATLAAIDTTAAVLAFSGLLVAVVLGAFIARRITRPLQELAAGAEAVAAGDLDKRLKVRTRDEVGDLVRAFNHMTGEVKDKKEKLAAALRVAAWQEIARRIAHEIKNPLFPIQTSVETLRKAYTKKHPDLDEIFDESTKMILEEVARLKNIVTEFSQFARMPGPKLAPCRLEEVLEKLEALYTGSEPPLVLEIARPLPPLLGDVEQLTQVFVNLVKNAREALSGSPSPRVLVRAAPAGEFIEASVVDNGPGYSEEVAERIFTPYFTTKEREGGTGLGLAIAQRIVTDHGGRIEARSRPGEGAAFTLWLPVLESTPAPGG